MSLLLDALKRAEQEKLAKQGDRAPEAQRARTVSATPANEAAPSLELAPLATAAPASSAPRLDAGSPATAQNMFQSKDSPAAQRASKGIWLWVALGVLVIGLSGAGIYVWMSVNAFTPRTVASSRPRPTQITQSAPVAEPAPKLDILAPPPQQPAAAIQPPASPPYEPAKAAAPSRADPREAVAALLRDSAVPATAPPVKFASAPEKARVSADVSTGYAALLNGDLAGARRSYAAAIAADPTNIDARLGAATIEARAGNRMLAASHYRKVLEVDPRNGTALAGLASLSDYRQTEGIESSLRAEIARDPQSAQLQYTLGNLYASQSRWNEAQVAYFEAHRLDPANPDVIYNLAVSLDQLRQPRLAAEYYRRALDAARGQATQFDPDAVTRRLAEIR
ncbi:MAG: hypothetical protein ACXWG1_03810 [Usitatibacter sp.]